MTKDRNGPVLIELDAPTPSPADAPAVVDNDTPQGQAMQSAAALAARQPSRLWRWFWRAFAGVVLFFATVAAWDAVAGLMARNEWLAWTGIALIAIFVAVCLAILIREWAALARLEKIEGFHDRAADILTAQDLDGARALSRDLKKLYAGRDDLKWATARMAERTDEPFDPETVLGEAETTLLAPLDARARAEVEAAARQVAGVTALVPLAFADVLAALTANIRMIRRIAEIYGGRSGTVGSWRLTRAVMTHLVATGAVAVGDDLLPSIGGGHVLTRLSRRFGEGLVNGALTARVGIAAIEVCRPLPFAALPRPTVTRIVQRALTGLFDRGEAP